jgi:hypothetical protein
LHVWYRMESCAIPINHHPGRGLAQALIKSWWACACFDDDYWIQGSSNVSVCVRVRPLLPPERLNRYESCVSIKGREVIVGPRTLDFDHVFNETVTQEGIYEQCVKTLVADCFRGESPP